MHLASPELIRSQIPSTDKYYLSIIPITEPKRHLIKASTINRKKKKKLRDLFVSSLKKKGGEE
jgi:hypothetical protein